MDRACAREPAHSEKPAIRSMTEMSGSSGVVASGSMHLSHQTKSLQFWAKT
jgi:hypothetical protein